MRSNWNLVDNPDLATSSDFPFAVLNGREVIALIKNRVNARFIAGAAGRISELESASSRNRRIYLGGLARRQP